jgi:trans-aconitate 2-methyltransferase
MPVREWDGASYDRISGVMQAMGLEVLERLELSGNETVIDAGCGSGRVTEALLERLPRGRVIGVDGSRSMIEAARERLGDRAELLVADLLELERPEPADAILSTATFHWIADHERLFRRLRACLRSGGRLVAQCGGEGNIAGLRARAMEVAAREPFAEHMRSFRAPWNYAGPEPTRARLLDAGFTAAETWLTPTPQQPEQPREFLETIVLQPHLQALPAELRVRFMEEVLERLGEPVVVDYVRLNIDARA